MNEFRAMWASQLQTGLQQMGHPLPAEQQQQLLDYLALLVKWNKAFNLTAVRDPDEMVSRQLLDSISILALLAGRRVLDVGTGPGLPGLVLAIARPDVQFVLIDSNGKKTRFVHQAITTLGLDNARVEQTRVETFQDAAGFDTITSRAFAALPKMLSLTEHLLATGGQLVAMKGTVPVDEISQVEAAGYQVAVKVLTVPGTLGQRHALTLTAAQATQ